MFYLFPQNLKFELILDDDTSFDHGFFDFTTVPPIKVIDDPMMHFIIDYIHKNFHTDISISELADKTCLEKNFFIKKLKRYMYITPYQYIRNYRTNTAMSLIKSNHYPISKITKMVGYANTASFSHAFKKVYDFYPNEFSENKHFFL